ncbi:KAP family NTPase [Jatrophihabitans cynanchi]|jgi:hypothetical protein|uniref:KAP family NTPase n=1 Tax=Jatrophihabitans cynanchi TaxID=2944128 RepID=A0ABY7K1Z9_9ACTN|nr:KAP family NTPase [Jatrophihabitans sp. SB3-54]WAX58005.1 KAP family NTPase [Jatrophihabitans sp. SB3-54]
MPQADNPIESASDDLLRRGKVAKSVSDSLRVVDASRGYVFGVLGPWGSGKTSLVNLVRENLAQMPAVPVLDFNPWMFSGAEQLMESFFNEMAGQLRLKGKRFTAIADSLDSYAQLLTPFMGLPVVGAWLARFRSASGYVKKVSDERKGTIQTRRADLVKHLSDLDVPIVVVIDDIDRLTTAEVREIFKLVRLTASFPNVIYLLAFDRRRVEEALTDDGVVGRDYLEKIMQTTVDIPQLPERLLLTTFGRVLNEAIDATGARIRFDEARWPDVLSEIVWPLIKNMRDVRRFASSIDASLRELQDDIELVDLLALEAIRVFMPDTFNAIYGCQAYLTEVRDTFAIHAGRDDIGKAAVESLIATAESEGHRDIASAMMERLFPAGLRYTSGSRHGSDWLASWFKARRVAHGEILRRYLERLAGEGMDAFIAAERLYGHFTDQAALEAALDEIEPSLLEDVISALTAYEHEYRAESVLPASVVLLNKLPSVPERQRGVWDLVDARIVVARVVLRLIRKLETEDDVLAIVKAALPQIRYLSSRLELITIVGHQEGAGHRLVAEADAAALETELGAQVVATPPAVLAGERDLLRLLYGAHKFGADVPAYLKNNGTPELFVAVISDARSFIRSQATGSRAVRRSARLSWEALVTVFGSQDAVRDAVDRARGFDDSEDFASLIDLADRYLGGWKPPDFGDDD